MDRIVERAATTVLIIAALYLAGHILAAWLRGSFDAVIHKSLEAIR